MYDVESKPPTGERSTRTILLVEDEARDAELISELIIESGRHGDRVLHVTSLQAALQTMAAEPVDLILLDLRLPDGVGLDCLQTVRQESVEIPVVVLTGVEDEHLALSCISGGAQDYLTKNELEGRTLNRAIAYALTRSRELSERRRANDLQRRLASIVEASQDAIVSISPDGLLMSWNPGAERTFGLGEVEALGRPFADFVRPLGADGETTDLSLDRLLAADQGMPIEMMSRRADGQRITLSVATCHLRDDDDRLIGLAAICRDVTEARRRRAELVQRNAELTLRDEQMRALTQRMNELIETERSRISRTVHDVLGQLLTAINLDLHWIGRRVPEKDERGIAAKIKEATELVERTVTEVQQISVDLRPSVLDSLGLAAGIRDELRRFQKRTGIRVDARIEDRASIGASAESNLFRILQELLTNVARHSRAARVSVGLVLRDGQLELQVADDGVGFAPEADRKLTSLGFLGIRERSLAIGGRCAIESAPGQGCRVSIAIPVAQDG
ncbi:MAG: response regulator [Planctomycetes bacterium]|nr:response regulator [Planctomycetota bacterium]